MTAKKIIEKIIELVIILVAAVSSIAVLLLVFPAYMLIPQLTEPTKWIADHQGWFGLFLVFIFIYQPVIYSFIGLARKYIGALLIIAAFLPWALIVSSSKQALALVGMFLWGSGGFGLGPEGGATVAGPTGEYIPSILAMILLSAGGVLGLYRHKRKFFNRKFSFVGGVLGVIAVIMWLVWVGNHIGWELWKSLFWAGADGFSSVSFGFFAATIGSYLLLTTPRAIHGSIKALGDNRLSVRKRAAKFLGKTGDPRAVEPLIKALGDEDPRVRTEAARALGEIGDPRAVEPLEKALEDKAGEVRKKAKTALNKIRRKSKEKRRR